MPWVRSLRIRSWLWIAWVENDYHDLSDQRLGWSVEHARNRTLNAHLERLGTEREARR